MAEASRRYMEEQFGETENEYRLSGAVLRLYVAYTHAVATLSRTPLTPVTQDVEASQSWEGGGYKSNPGGRCWRNATFHGAGGPSSSSSSLSHLSPSSLVTPPAEHTAFLRENWRFTAILERQGSSGTSTLAVSVPLGLGEGDSFFVTVPRHLDDPNYDPNGVAGVPYYHREGAPFTPPVRVTVPPKSRWTNGIFRVAV
jgi:hypothetical protein